jgi:hypothetical protein
MIVAHRENADNDTSRFGTFLTSNSIPKFTEDKDYEMKIRKEAYYLKDLEDPLKVTSLLLLRTPEIGDHI